MASLDTKPTITVHPAAAIFPLMSDEEIAELATSIKEHGLREKIQAVTSVHDTHTDWQVVDGRNRLEAIRRHLSLSDADIIANFMTPVNLATLHCTVEEYIMMANIQRRNLTQAQRRDLAGKLAIMYEEQQKALPKDEQVDTTQKAAEAAGVSRRTAATAKAKAKKPERVAADTTRTADQKDEKPKVFLLKPVNVTSQLENIGKTVSHESENEVGGEKVRVPYLDDWDIEQIQKARLTARFIADVLEGYLPRRVERERAAIQAKLDATYIENTDKA